MKILTFSIRFPNAEKPGHGIVVGTLLRRLAAVPRHKARSGIALRARYADRVAARRYGEQFSADDSAHAELRQCDSVLKKPAFSHA
jgi:hypothetical protein